MNQNVDLHFSRNTNDDENSVDIDVEVDRIDDLIEDVIVQNFDLIVEERDL